MLHDQYTTSPITVNLRLKRPVLACLKPLPPHDALGMMAIQSPVTVLGTASHATINLSRVSRSCSNLAYEHATILFDRVILNRDRNRATGNYHPHLDNSSL